MKWNDEKLFGLCFIIIGFFTLYSLLILLQHDGFTPKEKIGLAYSDNIDLSNIFFRFNTNTSPELIRIDYSLLRPMDKAGFIIIVLPYDGKITSSKNGWQEETLDSLQTTILFKKFEKSNNTGIGDDQDNIYFSLTNSIDSYRVPTRYLSIPFFSNPLDKDLTASVNGITNGVSFKSWNKISGPSEVSVIFSNADSWNTQPTAELTTEGNSVVAHWKITDNDPLYVLDFTNSQTRLLGSIVQTLGGVILGSGFGLIVAGKTRQRGEENQKKLQNFIKVQRHMQDANTSFTLKNYEGAKNSYDLAFKLNPEDIDPILLAGNSFYEMKRYDDAITYCKKVLAINPKHVGALNNMGASTAGLGNHDDAISYYEQVFDLAPNHTDSINNMGSAILELGFPECAIPYFEEAITINKKDIMAIANKGKAIASYNHKDAMKYFDEALKIKLDYIPALMFKALSLNALEHYEEALACLNLILKIEPTHTVAIHNKGAALIGLDRFEEALPCFDEYLITAPTDAGALYNKGLCLGKQGDLKGMKFNFEESLKNGQSDIGILNNMGIFLCDVDPDKAIKECFMKVLKIDEKNLLAISGMNQAFTKLGNKPEADAWLQKFSEVKSDLEKSKKS